MDTQIEICCGSYHDIRQAKAEGAKRIELNSTLHMDDLTPGVAALRLIKEHTKLGVMTMTRPRGTGFHYLSQDYDVMVEETGDMIKSGADGIILGYLGTYGNTDTKQSGHITILAKMDHEQVIFHHTFDCVKDPFKAIETLIDIGVGCVLTNGTYPTAFEGKEIMRQLQEHYGDQVEMLAGCGIDAMDTKELIAYTGVKQIHPSCEGWLWDETTRGEHVTYSYRPQSHKSDYEVVNSKKVKHLIWNARQPSAKQRKISSPCFITS